MPKLKYYHRVQTGTGKENKKRQRAQRTPCQEVKSLFAEAIDLASPHGLKVQSHGQGDESSHRSRTQHRVQVHLRILNHRSPQKQHL